MDCDNCGVAPGNSWELQSDNRFPWLLRAGKRIYQNGIKIGECTYVNGIRHGLSTKWTQGGIMYQQSTYENGVLVN